MPRSNIKYRLLALDRVEGCLIDETFDTLDGLVAKHGKNLDITRCKCLSIRQKSTDCQGSSFLWMPIVLLFFVYHCSLCIVSLGVSNPGGEVKPQNWHRSRKRNFRAPDLPEEYGEPSRSPKTSKMEIQMNAECAFVLKKSQNAIWTLFTTL